MIPAMNNDIQLDFGTSQPSSRTHRLNISKDYITGYTDGLDAMRQAIYFALNVERYQHLIYSWNYGVELLDLIGQPISYVLPEIKRRISEALLMDSRITSVDGFEFDVQRGKVLVKFRVSTIFGDLEAERAVVM